MPLSHHHSKRGFTLTELAVVALIVFVLGVILYPVFASSRRRYTGRRASCGSNQKQIALGFLQYIQDYDGHFPPAVQYRDLRTLSDKPTLPPFVVQQIWGPDRKLPDGRILPGLLSPYLKSNVVFFDHEQNVPSGDKYVNRHDGSVFALYYMYNDLLSGVNQAVLPAVSLTVLTTDAEDRLGNAGHALASNSVPEEAKFNRKGGCDPGKGASIGSARIRHINGANFAFTDGHVKWHKGGVDDRVFFPPRESASISSVDAKTKQQIGPKPGGDMVFAGRKYEATFHVK